MARVVYNLSSFDATKAASGALCVMVEVGTTGTIANVNEDGTANKNFVGAGICRHKDANTYIFSVNSTTYQFDQYGKGKSWDIRDYKLMLADADVNITTSGNAAKSRGTTIVTRGTDGATTTKVDYSKESDIIIDTLNARDEFAVQALRELLSHIQDPSSLSNTEMSFYCNTAYQWAANMMEASANARGTFQQESSSSGETTDSVTTRADVEESSLSSNQEKLLNNIVAALERTCNVETVGTSLRYSQRVKVQFTELIDFLNTYVKNGEGTVGLKDLISAINTIKDSNSTILNKIVDVSNNQTTAIQSLKTTTDNQEKSIKTLSDAVDNLNSGSLTTADIDARIKSWLGACSIVADGDSGYKLSIPESI